MRRTGLERAQPGADKLYCTTASVQKVPYATPVGSVGAVPWLDGFSSACSATAGVHPRCDKRESTSSDHGAARCACLHETRAKPLNSETYLPGLS